MPKRQTPPVPSPLTDRDLQLRRQFLEASRNDAERYRRDLDAARTPEDRDAAQRELLQAERDVIRLEALGSDRW